MKAPPLTESIGRTSENRSESSNVQEGISRSVSGDVQLTTSGSAVVEHVDATESVTVSIKSSSGYEDAEHSRFWQEDGERVRPQDHGASLRAYERRDDDAASGSSVRGRPSQPYNSPRTAPFTSTEVGKGGSRSRVPASGSSFLPSKVYNSSRHT